MSEVRLPPHNELAEKQVLGCILDAAASDGSRSLTAQECVDKCIERFGAADVDYFYDIRHREIWKVVKLLHKDNKAMDVTMVWSGLQHFEKGEAAGGLLYVSGLQDDAVLSAIDSYLEELHDEFLARQALRIASEITQAVYHKRGEVPIRESVSAFEQSVLQLTTDHAGVKEQSAADGARTMAELIDNMKRGTGMVTGLKTGFEYFDRMTTGLHDSEMFVLAGRPSTGKTQLAMNIAQNIAEGPEGAGVGVFSLEMNGVGMWSRFLFQLAGADYQRFRTGGFTTSDEVPAITQALARMPDYKIWLDETSGLTIGEIRARARRMKREHGIKVWIIDYFHLIRPDVRRHEMRAEYNDISMSIKAMAKELDAPVIILAQLNRDSEKDNRVPQGYDLKECGQLEQDADLIGILHKPKLRSEPYDGQGQSERDLFEENAGAWHTHKRRINLHVCKQRNGPTGPVEFVSLTKSMSFVEFDRSECKYAKPSGKDNPEDWEE